MAAGPLSCSADILQITSNKKESDMYVSELTEEKLSNEVIDHLLFDKIVDTGENGDVILNEVFPDFII